MNREFIQVRNVQSSKLRRRGHAEGPSHGELPSKRGEIEVVHIKTLFKWKVLIACESFVIHMEAQTTNFTPKSLIHYYS